MAEVESCINNNNNDNDKNIVNVEKFNLSQRSMIFWA